MENVTAINPKISAIILAAGLSSRMGALKPLLRIGDRTMLEHGIRLFRDSGVDDVIVVVGHRAAEIIPVVENTGARWVMNHGHERGMFSSVQAGVETLHADVRAFFILPTDIPLVGRPTVKLLMEAYRKGAGKIVFPVFHGRRGHPPLVDARYRPEILAYPGEGGLRAVFAGLGAFWMLIEVDDDMTVFDLDTPADYRALTGNNPRNEGQE